MTEIDLFLKLLDEKATDELLKVFGQYVKSNSTPLKKINLKKIFRGLYNNGKKIKAPINSFDFAIKKYVNPTFKKYRGQELFQLLNKGINSQMPNYIKFANALFYEEKITKENLERINQNYEKKFDLFKGIIEFTCNEDVEKELMKNYNYSLSIKKAIIEYIMSNLDKELVLKLDEIRSVTYDWTLVDYINNFTEQGKEYPLYLIQMSYLNSHENRVEIENGIALDMLYNFLPEKEFFDNGRNTINNSIKEIEKLNKYLNEFKKKNEKIQQENNKIIRENKQLINNVSMYKKNIDNVENEVLFYKNMIEKNNIEKFKLEAKIEEMKHIIENVTIENKKNQRLYRKIEKEMDELTLKNNKLNEKLQSFNTYIDYTCSIVENSQNKYEFAIITSIETELCKKLYPEILFLNARDWEKDNSLVCQINGIVKKIYIQRLGLSSSKISSIERFSKKNRIQTQIIVPKNEKDMIEIIVKLKNNL